MAILLNGSTKRTMNEIKEVALSDIKVRRSRRPSHNVDELAESVKTIGLLQPIVVSQTMDLIAGRSRLEALKKLGHSKVNARILDCTELTAELAEIDENLIRSELSVLERSELLARRKELYEQMHPETKKAGPGRGRKEKKNRNNSRSFSADVAAKTKVDVSTVRSEVRIAKNLTPQTKEVVRGTDVENHKVQLAALSRVPPDKQPEVARKLTSGQARSVEHACKLVGIPSEDPRKRAKDDPDCQWVVMLHKIERFIDRFEQVEELQKVSDKWPASKKKEVAAQLITMQKTLERWITILEEHQ